MTLNGTATCKLRNGECHETQGSPYPREKDQILGIIQDENVYFGCTVDGNTTISEFNKTNRKWKTILNVKGIVNYLIIILI